MAQWEWSTELPQVSKGRQRLERCAKQAGVQINITEKKGLILVSYYYTVTGSPAQINRFKEMWRAEISNYDLPI